MLETVLEVHLDFKPTFCWKTEHKVIQLETPMVSWQRPVRVLRPLPDFWYKSPDN